MAGIIQGYPGVADPAALVPVRRERRFPQGLPGRGSGVLNPLVADRPAPIPQAVRELYELVVAYFKQETTEPLKALGRVLAFGILGSLLLGTGVVFAAVGVLRVVQQETSAFDGNWSFVPYVIVIVALLGTAFTVFKVGTRTKDGSS